MSLHAQALLPLLLRACTSRRARQRQALDMLRRWDGDVSAASSAPRRSSRPGFCSFASSIVGDDLGPRDDSSYDGRFSFVTRFLINTLTADTIGRGATTCGRRGRKRATTR